MLMRIRHCTSTVHLSYTFSSVYLGMSLQLGQILKWYEFDVMLSRSCDIRSNVKNSAESLKRNCCYQYNNIEALTI